MVMGLYERAAAATSGPGCPEPLVVDWFSTRLRVHTDDVATRDYLASQHHTVAPIASTPPWLSPPVTGHADLHAVADPELLCRIRDTVTGPTRERREAFRGEWYALHRSPTGEDVLLAEEGHKTPHALITIDYRSFALVAQNPAGARLVIARTVRELVREDLLARGALMFHGAAGQRAEGSGALLVGGESTGKTTSAIRIAHGGGRVVGTDRVLLLRHGNGQWIAVGLPMSTRLGAGSVQALGLADMLRDRAPIRAINPFQREATEVPKEAATRYGLDKVWLSNAEIHELLGCGFTAATTVDTLVVLDNAGDAAPRVDRLSPDEAATELAAHLMAPDPDFRSRWLSADPTPESAEAAREQLDRLRREQAVIRVAWDPTRHCDERVPDLLCPGEHLPPH